jgi:hypothetical protein
MGTEEVAMPDASGRFRGISMSGIENPWLDSLARVEEHEPCPCGADMIGPHEGDEFCSKGCASYPYAARQYVVIDETHRHTPEQLTEFRTAYEEAMQREHNR